MTYIPINFKGQDRDSLISDGRLNLGPGLVMASGMPPTLNLADNLVLTGKNGVRLPGGTTAERPASPAAGTCRFNSTLGIGEIYQGGQWVPLGGGGVTGLTSAQIVGADGATSGPMLFLADATRGGKKLSVAQTVVQYWLTTADTDDWLQVMGSSNAESGFVMPYGGTVTAAAGQVTGYSSSSSKRISLYVETAETANILDLGVTGLSKTNTDLNVDFAAGQRLRLRARSGSGWKSISNLMVTLWVHWRV